MFIEKCKLCTFMKTTLTYTSCVHKLRTRVHLRNFSVHKIAAYTTCTQTYFYVQKSRAREFSIFQVLI